MNNKLKEIMMENVEFDKSLWEGYEEWLDEQAALHSYERSLEI
jgi:hypothetical protein